MRMKRGRFSSIIVENGYDLCLTLTKSGALLPSKFRSNAEYTCQGEGEEDVFYQARQHAGDTRL